MSNNTTPQGSTGTIDKQVFGMDIKVLAGFAALVFYATQQFTEIKNNIDQLKAAPAAVKELDIRVNKTSQELESLKTSVDGIKTMTRQTQEDLKNFSNETKKSNEDILNKMNGIENTLSRIMFDRGSVKDNTNKGK